MKKSILLLVVSSIFLLGLFLTPLLFLPEALIVYEVPKVKFFLVWSCLLLFCVFIVFLFYLKLKIVLPARFLLAGFFWLSLFAISLFGVDIQKSLFGNFYRWDGLITLLSLMSFGVCVYVLKKVVEIERLTFLSLLFSFLVTFFWSTWQYFFNEGIVYAGFGNPVFLLGYVFVVSPILLFGAREYISWRWGRPLVLVMISVFGIMTGTIFGYLMPPFCLFALMYLEKKLNKFMLFVFLLLVLLIGFMMYFLEQDKLQGIIFEGRERIFMKSILAFADRPLIGWGYANFDVAFASFDWPIKLNNDVYMDKAHSHLLEYLVTTGLLGLFLYLILLFFLFRDIRDLMRVNGRYLFLTLVFYLIHSQTNVVGISEEIVFWLVYGLVDSG